MHVYNNRVIADDGQPVGTFSDHLAAFAAFVRLTNPEFQLLRGLPTVGDAREETLMRERLANRK